MTILEKNTTAPAIFIKNLSYNYPNYPPTFHNFNIEFPAAKCVCLLGKSGVGKSTLLKLIANLISSSSKLNITTSDNEPIQSRISYMAQQDLLMPWLSVFDNVLFGYRLRNENKNKEQALKILTQVGLEKVVKQKPFTLSGGMRQRVALARTLMENKLIILMDEPFANLDVITRFNLQNLAAELLVNHTVILVTHDPLEALRLADMVYVLSGTPAKLSKPIIPKGQIPRKLTDSNILKLQAELLEQFTSEQT